MSATQASCPACAGPVTFQLSSSLVTVCEFCHSVVARTDRKLEDLGKVAAIVETASPLQLGLKGRFEDRPFEIVGRAQLRHELGGVWDEWYCAFPKNQWGWLAEAQGRFYMTFEMPAVAADLPQVSELVAGEKLRLSDEKFTVGEVGVAHGLGAEGEMPYRLQPGAHTPFVDLYGPQNRFATLDYGDTPPTLYLGQELTLAELGIPESARAAEKAARQVSGVQVNCPQCAGPLNLIAPDQAQRVTCPSCNALLDAEQGALRYLSTLSDPRDFDKPVLELGAKGTLRGVEYTVLGFLRRSVTFDRDYFWTEYLLYQPRIGFRWLVHSDSHFSFIEPVSPAEIVISGQRAFYQGHTFKIFQHTYATVRYVMGEFYWKVEVGERVDARDFIAPPEMISIEQSTRGGADVPGDGIFLTSVMRSEINVSLGTYLPHAEVQQAFGITLRPATGIAPNQPFPYAGIYRWWGLFAGLLVLLAVALFITSANRPVHQEQVQIQPGGEGNPQTLFAENPLEFHARRNVQIEARSSVDNSWVFLAGDFFNEETGFVQSFELPVEYYHGTEGGESWSEGSRTRTTYVSALPPGKYTMRLEMMSGTSGRPETVSVTVREGVPRIFHFVLALGLISFIPICVVIYHVTFESQRWKDSQFSSANSGSDDD